MDVRAMVHREGGEVLLFGAWTVRALRVARGPVTVNEQEAEAVCDVSDDVGVAFAPCTEGS